MDNAVAVLIGLLIIGLTVLGVLWLAHLGKKVENNGAEVVKAKDAGIDVPSLETEQKAPLEMRRALGSGWKRTAAFALAACVFYLPYVIFAEANANTVGGGLLRVSGSIGLMLFIISFAHRIRVALRPYVDLRELVELAKAGNVAASQVALATIIAEGILIGAFVNAMMFR